jgi:hypothetical protein
MKKLVLASIVFLTTCCTAYVSAQKKATLYLQLGSTYDAFNDLNFYAVGPPHSSKRKLKIESLDSLINYDSINAVIKKMDYKGVRILSELSLIGWKLESTVFAAKTPNEVLGGPSVIFIMSKEFVIEDKKQ